MATSHYAECRELEVYVLNAIVRFPPHATSTTRESRLRSAWAVARRINEVLQATPPAPRHFRSTDPGVPTDLAAAQEQP